MTSDRSSSGPGSDASDYEDRLAAWVGRRIQEPEPGQDPVNVPMIRHWVEAMEVSNPVHLDAGAARATGRSDVVAPASMVQAWTMRGYARTVRPEQAAAGATDAGEGADAEEDDGMAALTALLAEGGYTSVVATDSELDFSREVHPGEEILADETVEQISEEKQTALGPGRFVSTVKTYRARPAGTDGEGEVVATQQWRLLRFRPAEGDDGSGQGAGGAASASTGSTGTDEGTGSGEERALRPRPALNADNRFWFDAAAEHRLVIQRCADCGRLRHPPGPQCPHCQSFHWDTVEASGQATLYSFTVAHHPRHPAFDYPLVVGVVELAEGTRLISNVVDVDPADVRIGMPLALTWCDADPELTLPLFRPEPEEDD